jgi:hypothetical protein
MKKTLLTLLVGVMALTASAETYYVYSGNSTDETQLPKTTGYTSNMDDPVETEDPDAPGGKYWRFTNKGTDTWAMYGLKNTTDFDVANLKKDNMYLIFSARSTAENMSWRVKLEGQNSANYNEVAFDLANDGEWHEIKWKLSETFPNVYSTLESGQSIFIFSVVPKRSDGGNLLGGEIIDIANARYETIEDETTDNSGETGGDNSETGETWESHYYGDITTTVKNENDLTIHYELIADSKCEALTINATFEGEEKFDGVVREFWIGIDGKFISLNATSGEYAYTGKFEKAYTKGEDLSGAYFRFATSVGGVTPHLTYAYGDDNSDSYSGSGDSGETGEGGDNGEGETGGDNGETGDTWESHYYGDITTKVVTDNDLTIHYELIANSECKALTINATFDGEENFGGVVREFWIGIDGKFISLNATSGEYAYTGKFEKAYTKGEDLSGAYFRFATSVGGVTPHITYSYGDDNSDTYVKPVVVVKPTLTAEATDVTANSANIKYNVTLPSSIEGATVKVYLNNEETTANPIALTELDANTAYSYKLKAVATLADTEYTSDEVEVSFTTLAEDAKEAVWYTIVDGLLTNAYIDGEGESSRHAVPFSCPVKVTYNLNKTITTEITLQGSNKKVVGLVPKINDSGIHDMAHQSSGVYTYTTTATYNVGDVVPGFYLYMAYNGGAANIDINGYTAGAEGTEVAYGSAKEMTLSTTATNLKVGDAIPVYAAVKDENGHYLIDAAVTYDFKKAEGTDAEYGEYLTYDNGVFTAARRGEAVITATCGEATGSLTVVIYTEATAEDLTSKIGADGSKITASTDGENLDSAFDGKADTWLNWDCTQSARHYLCISLGEKTMIEAIHLVWKAGYYPTAFTISITDKPSYGIAGEIPVQSESGSSTNSPRRSNGKVYSSTGDYTFTNDANITGDVNNDYVIDDGGIDAASYLELITTAANSDAIQLASITVAGTADSDVMDGVDTVLSEEEAPVEFYTLSGIRVKGTPAAGLYIRRQGSKATKVLVK